MVLYVHMSGRWYRTDSMWRLGWQELKQLLEDGPVCPDSKQAVLEYFKRKDTGLLC